MTASGWTEGVNWVDFDNDGDLDIFFATQHGRSNELYENSGQSTDHGLRLDHIWASEEMADRCANAWIDKEPRGLKRPSDHTSSRSLTSPILPLSLDRRPGLG